MLSGKMGSHVLRNVRWRETTEIPKPQSELHVVSKYVCVDVSEII